MRIEVFGEKSFVTSAFVTQTVAGLHLLVNVREKWALTHCQGGSMFFVPPVGQDATTYDTVVFENPTIDDEELRYNQRTEVVVIAETPQDAAMLNRCCKYQSQCKDQFYLLYVQDIEPAQEALAEYRTGSGSPMAN
jgi:hypothetical protein